MSQSYGYAGRFSQLFAVLLLDSLLVFSYTECGGADTILLFATKAMTDAAASNGVPAGHPPRPLQKALILSAGQGKRLLPLTANQPKCLLPVDADRPILALQLRALAQCGIRQVTVMVGFAAEKVEYFLGLHPTAGLEVRTRYNPFFETSNNLATCWLAIPEMTEDFVLLNGDTLFQTEILRRVLAYPDDLVTLAIDRKTEYDDDDMKISLNGGRQLTAIGKTLARHTVHGESIGLMAFRGKGVGAFRTALEQAVREPAALHRWYLDVINTLSRSIRVETALIEGLWWAEVDTCEDLEHVRRHFVRRREQHGQMARLLFQEGA